MSDELFFRRIVLLKRLGWLALAGFAVGLIGLGFARASADPPPWTFVAFVLIVPALVYLVLLTMWHWKGRYIGTHSDLWGGVLLIETSGWSKLIYLFRHIIPDARGTGRYARSGSSAHRPEA
jgi:hypothetical protein